MAAFCHFWRMTPTEYRRLRLSEQQAMIAWMEKVNRG